LIAGWPGNEAAGSAASREHGTTAIENFTEPKGITRGTVCDHAGSLREKFNRDGADRGNNSTVDQGLGAMGVAIFAAPSTGLADGTTL
jgi:hypothetical protein